MQKIIFLLTILLSVSCFALEGELVPKSTKTLDLEEGSLFDGVLRVWPVGENWNLKQLESLAGKNIGEAFNLVRIESVERSSHNAEVVELRGLFALIKAVSPKTKITISLDSSEVLLEIRRLNLIATAPPAQQFELVEQPVSIPFLQGQSPIVIGAGSILLVILMAVGFRKISEKRHHRKNLLLAKKEIESAQSRAELEQVGRKIEKYQSLLNIPPEKVNGFKKNLDLYQYRPSWTDDQLADVRKSVESLLNDR